MRKPGDAPLDEHLDEAFKDEQEGRRRRARENTGGRGGGRQPEALHPLFQPEVGRDVRLVEEVEQIAREIKPDDWELFLRVIDETKAFAETVALARG